MISYSIKGLDELGASFQLRATRIVGRVTTTMRGVGAMLVGAIKEQKLSGQVLKNRTGRLRRSINAKLQQDAQTISLRVGTNVEYARAHEFGFSGAVKVSQHLRLVKQAWGRKIKPRNVTVRAHVRHMELPERSFMRTAMAENRAEVEGLMAQAIREGSRAAA